MALDARVFPLAPELDEDGKPVPIEFQDVDYVSFVNHETFGKPAIIAPGPDHVSPEGELVVLYVNTGGVAAIEVTRT